MLKFLQQPNRRQFLQVMAGSLGALVVGCSDAPPTSQASTPAPTSALEQLNAFVKIGSDDTVTVMVKHAEFGQGTSTGLTAIVAEELDADWAQMKWEFAPADVKLYANTLMGIQGTGGSSSIANSWQQLRQAGATARALLVAAAAQAWGVAAAEILVEAGKISHPGGKQSGFGAFAAAAAKLKAPSEVKLKDPKDFKLIGKPLARLDGAVKSRGQAEFTIDHQIPGMRIAAILHPPRFGAKLKKVDTKAALAVAGVFEVVEIPRGVAVVAKDFWSAQKGRRALVAEWDESQAEKRGSPQLRQEFHALLEKAGKPARNEGQADKRLAAAKKTVSADYDFPFLAHAPMEPLGCTVDFKDGEADLYYGAQLHTVDQANAATTLGIPQDKVRIHSLFGGGSFGRRAVPDSDYVVEACAIAKAVKEKTPIKLIWDRSNDLRGGRYRPMSAHRMVASLGPDGMPVALLHRIVKPSFLADSPFAMMIRDGIDATSVEGSANSDYQVEHFKTELHSPKIGIPTLWWRSVGHTANAYVMETFIDQMAAEAGQDPIEYRRKLLPKDSRRRGALELAVEKAGPFEKSPGRGRGVAVHESFASYVAQVVDVSVKDGKTKIEKIVCAVDCGIVINPDQVKAQMQSGILYGLSAALGEAITLKDGVVQQSNFDSYPVLRMPATPPIEVYLVESNAPPTGTGEPGTPVIAPALANAYQQATGKRLTQLPLSI